MSTAVLSRPRLRTRQESTRGPIAQQRASRRKADLQDRARTLMLLEIDFIPNASFDHADADESSRLDKSATCPEASRDQRVPRDLPGHLARLCSARILTADEEARLFRRMNFLKFQADAARVDLDPEQPNRGEVERVEQILSEARAIRDRIVQANMRLVMSVVKKFVTPQHSFDDMLSDGIYSLMQAADKFDYDRGFRFSTYAYRAIARNAFRKINDRQKEASRYAASSDQAVFDALDDRGSSTSQDAAWVKLRGLLSKFVDRLDRRERFIIRSRYALGAHRKVRTFQCLANKLGVSKERVRQLEQRAVAKMQSFAAEHSVEELVGPALH